MNLEHISVENHQRFHQSYLPSFEESTIFLPPCPIADRKRKRKNHATKFLSTLVY
jgi:hypothetical protein